MGYGAVDRWTVARPNGRAAGSWNRRAVNIADREFGQSQEPASRQVVLRKAEPARQGRRGADGQASAMGGSELS
jgi:hypothetical protein